MSVKEFEDRTSVTMAKRGPSLSRISDKLKAYIKTPGDAQLKELWYALDGWQSHHLADPKDHESWSADRRNKKSAITDLTNWVKRKMNEDAILAFKRAATLINQIYGPSMDDQYHQHFVDIFVNSEVDSTEPFTSIIHWKNQNHWNNRLAQVGCTESQGTTNGFTTAWDGPTIASATKQLCAGIKGLTAPLDRIVEVFDLNHHSICHELLHWVTHESFKKHFASMADGDLRKYINEGLTEWLTRKALNEWDTGGYVDFIPLWKRMATDNTVVYYSALSNAYFKGKNLDELQTKIEAYTKTDKDYQDAKKAAMIAHLKRMKL